MIVIYGNLGTRTKNFVLYVSHILISASLIISSRIIVTFQSCSLYSPIPNRNFH